MVDFASIRAYRGSQHTGFEELVVQLAHRRPPIGAREFRRVEGAGGDAGVEALWLLHDGSEIGIQAKYFLRVRDIDWAQIDKRAPMPGGGYELALACDEIVIVDDRSSRPVTSTAVKFAVDSLLEQDGFEPSVPLAK